MCRKSEICCSVNLKRSKRMMWWCLGREQSHSEEQQRVRLLHRIRPENGFQFQESSDLQRRKRVLALHRRENHVEYLHLRLRGTTSRRIISIISMHHGRRIVDKCSKYNIIKYCYCTTIYNVPPHPPPSVVQQSISHSTAVLPIKV